MPEHRRSFRYPAHLAERDATVYIDGEGYESVIIDESMGGVAILLPRNVAVRAGQQLDVEEIGVPVGRKLARVMHALPEEPGIQRVGLEWL